MGGFPIVTKKTNNPKAFYLRQRYYRNNFMVASTNKAVYTINEHSTLCTYNIRYRGVDRKGYATPPPPEYFTAGTIQ